MQIVVKISDELYQMCRNCVVDAHPIERAIANGVPLKQNQVTKIAHKIHSDGFSHCSHCNSIVLDSAKYCNNCGYKLESEK